MCRCCVQLLLVIFSFEEQHLSVDTPLSQPGNEGAIHLIREDNMGWSAWKAAVQPALSMSRALAGLLMLLHLMPMSARRDLLLLTRVRDHPDNNPFLLYHLAHYSYATRMVVLGTRRVLNMDLVYPVLYPFLQLNFINSYISMLCKSVPFYNYPYEEHTARVSSAEKEFAATQTETKPQVLSYDFLFSDDPMHATIHPTIPPRPQLCEEIRSRLRTWLNVCSSTLLYPRTSTRSVSSDTQRIAYDNYPEYFSHRGKISTSDLESFYHETGVRITGRVEMRQAWFYNDLKPRTYFALGGRDYFACRYIQMVFNLLLDAFPNTHRLGRFNLDRLYVHPQDHVVVYDFSDFTSRMSEQKYFLQHLAEFARGTVIHLLDTFHGIIVADLGELIETYNRVCNIYPEFSIAEPLRNLMGRADLVYCHRCAGFLGVHGNLATCTVLHGLVLAFVTGSFDRCTCVGDDALGIVRVHGNFQRDVEEGEIVYDQTTDTLLENMSLIGDINLLKTATLRPFTDEDEFSDFWAFLKRRMTRDEIGLHLDKFFNIPSIGLAYHEDIITDRKMRYEMTRENVVFRLVTQTTSLLFHIANEKPGVEEAWVVFSYLNYVYDRWKLPKAGYLRGVSTIPRSLEGRLSTDLAFVPILPTRREEVHAHLLMDPLELMMERYDFEEVAVPVVSLKGEYDFSWMVGSSFRSTGSKLLGLLEMLGYLQKEVLFESVGKLEALERLRLFLRSRSRNVCRYTVLKDLPVWVSDVLLRG